ncbi:DUF2878 family protein [Chromobacterium violaceum]|uniref:Protein of uncharacterized function (DUF2878) n=1 Tax=Chromobacterium violaceum TaxID=536 RepID=A0A1R0MN02_CHRVL|nr:DUF2878 family protein [Chromobacterium violaceum]MBA8733353.1 DUF2878 family protein [Chromobacterium violaceum]MBT2865727.1 DUF2878 family protein [Chromobacterium violaceum]MCD0492878.1 DUF2878 domain-containing protein [Chromobacterium violaceum]OLZ81138.1 hypothetical protein BS642_09290 [Chromobacterium violaceum]OVE48092.1 hypothetical protein CBW21_11575 [Chromobacterium violaceum]
MKTPWIKPVLASLAFGGWWLLLTLCRDRWVMVTLAAALLLWEALPSGLRGRALLLAGVGCLLDLALAASGLLRFAGVGALPLWMMVWWLSFACWWLWLLQSWRPSPRLLMLLGGLAAPLARYAAFKSQALQPGAAWWLLLPLLALMWAALLPQTLRLIRHAPLADRH